MSRRVRVKPSKGQSLAGFFSGLVFCFIGIFHIIPTFGWFGLAWTLFAVIFTIISGYNAFTDKGVASHEIIIDDTEKSNDSSSNASVQERLTELKSLYDKNLITDEEYQNKRDKILNDI